MMEFKEEVAAVNDIFDLEILSDENLDWIFAGFYTEFTSPHPTLVPSFAKNVPSHVNAALMIDKMGLKYQQLLTREAARQGLESTPQFYTALILAAHPEYKAVRVAGTDYLIVESSTVQQLLDSDYFKGYAVNCKVEVL